MRIGLKDLKVAMLTKDDLTGVTYAAEIISVPGIREAKINPKTDTVEVESDDAITESETVVTGLDMEIDLKSLTLVIRKSVYNKLAAKGIIREKSTDEAPWIALGFMAKKLGGGYEYRWYPKCKAEPIGEDFKTKGNKVDVQTDSIKFKVVPRTFDEEYRIIGDDSDPTFEANKFFTVNTLTNTTPVV